MSDRDRAFAKAVPEETVGTLDVDLDPNGPDVTAAPTTIEGKYSRGDLVFLRIHGVLAIAGATLLTLRERSTEVYLLVKPEKPTQLVWYVPVESESLLRELISAHDADLLLESMSEPAQAEPDKQWNELYRAAMVRIATGEPTACAFVARELITLRGIRPLKFGEERLLREVVRLLASEIAVAKKLSRDDAIRRIDPEQF